MPPPDAPTLCEQIETCGRPTERHVWYVSSSKVVSSRQLPNRSCLASLKCILAPLPPFTPRQSSQVGAASLAAVNHSNGSRGAAGGRAVWSKTKVNLWWQIYVRDEHSWARKQTKVLSASLPVPSVLHTGWPVGGDHFTMSPLRNAAQHFTSAPPPPPTHTHTPIGSTWSGAKGRQALENVKLDCGLISDGILPRFKTPSHFPNTLPCVIFVLQFQPAKPLLKRWYWAAARVAQAVCQAPTMTHPWPKLVNIPFIFLLAPREIIPAGVGGTLPAEVSFTSEDELQEFVPKTFRAVTCI